VEVIVADTPGSRCTRPSRNGVCGRQARHADEGTRM
jgi:hypothetical protein